MEEIILKKLDTLTEAIKTLTQRFYDLERKMRVTSKFVEGADEVLDTIEHSVSIRHAPPIEMILDILYSTYPESVSHSVLLRRIYRRLVHGAAELHAIMDTLEKHGKIEQVNTTKGLFYVLSDKAYEEKQQKSAPAGFKNTSGPWDALSKAMQKEIDTDNVIDLTTNP